MPEHCDAEAVADRIRDGDHVVLDTSRPRSVGGALAARDGLQDVTVSAYGFPYADPAPLAALADRPGITVRVSMAGPGLRDPVAAGDIEFVPRTFLAVARAPVTTPDRRVVALLATPPAVDGSQPLGPLSAYGEALVDTADVVVAERNPALPALARGRTLPPGAVDYAVTVTNDLPTLEAGTPTDAERDTAATIATSLPDRPTVQLGAGRIPTELGRRLAETGAPLTIHSGLLGESIRPVVAAGISDTVRGCMAVDDVDLSVESGEVRSVIGPNGAGKTTLFNLLTGTYQVTAGDIVFDGDDITGVPEYERPYLGISRGYQITNTYESLTVFENVQTAVALFHENYYDMVRRLDGRTAVTERAEALLKELGLADRRDVEASALSHGDRRRLEIGMALAAEPRLLLLDEPTAGMDASETQRTVSLIETLTDDMAVLLVEHDIEYVMAVSDTITVLERGSVIAEGPPAAIRQNERVQEAYLGGRSDA